MTADDEIDRLYGVDPGDFTALRTELVAAAKERGDAEAAKRIAGARRPTTAAWVVNVLMRCEGTARTRLTDLAERLRAAHGSMDGGRIRELSAAQRRLVDELTRTGFAAAGLAQPSAALRDDVVGTLQAALAAPDVLARLGSLAKAERWSGFGEFGEATTVGPALKSELKSHPEPKGKAERTEADVAVANDRIAFARVEVEAAQEASTAAAKLLAERTATVVTARRRYEKLLESVDVAEQALNAADHQLEVAEQVSQEAAGRLDAAASDLDLAESDLARLNATRPQP